jgi:hypothetical protein
MSYTNLNNPANYQLQSFGQDGMRTISTTQAYVEGEYYRVLVATEDSTLSATSMVGDDLASIDVYAGTTIYGLFTAVTVTAGEVTAYLAGRTDIDDVWAYIRAYGEANGATIEGEDCAKAAISPLLDKYYAQASLVMVPSLYKTSIVYSERPLSTDGELTFSRASSATRVGPDGLIEKVRTNLLTYSNDFTNAAWLAGGTHTRTANNAIAPDGTTTASTLYFTLAGGTQQIYQNFSSSATYYTSSVYLRSATGSALSVSFGFFDGVFKNDTISVGTTWQRFEVSKLLTATTSRGVWIFPNEVDATLEIWHAQLEAGTIATDYIATTSAAVSVGPVANVPRLDYLGSSCPRLLLEPQRTNLVTYSEQFDNAAWSKVNATITANDAVSPDGYTNADKLVSTGGASRVERFPTLADNTDYTASIFAKKGSVNLVAISFLKKNNVQDRVFFNLLDGSIGTTEGSPISKSIQEYGDYYRVTITSNSSSGATSPRIQYLIGAIDNNVVTTSGDFIYIYGAQFEAGAYGTSYIPTLAAAVTRGADLASKTGISSLIGQTEGTIFVEIDSSQFLTGSYIGISDGTTTNRQIFGWESDSGDSGALRLYGFWNFGYSSFSRGQKIKVALAYKNNDFALYVNGTQAGTNSGATISGTMSQFAFNSGGGSQNYQGNVYQTLLFKTRLTNAQLAELTTL